MTLARRSSAAAPITASAASFDHCGETEYVAFLAGLPVTQGFRAMRRRYRYAFVDRWPKIDDWFDAPFEERIGRLRGETQKLPSYPASYRARSYLFYLALTGPAVSTAEKASGISTFAGALMNIGAIWSGR